MLLWGKRPSLGLVIPLFWTCFHRCQAMWLNPGDLGCLLLHQAMRIKVWWWPICCSFVRKCLLSLCQDVLIQKPEKGDVRTKRHHSKQHAEASLSLRITVVKLEDLKPFLCSTGCPCPFSGSHLSIALRSWGIHINSSGIFAAEKPQFAKRKTSWFILILLCLPTEKMPLGLGFPGPEELPAVNASAVVPWLPESPFKLHLWAVQRPLTRVQPVCSLVGVNTAENFTSKLCKNHHLVEQVNLWLIPCNQTG